MVQLDLTNDAVRLLDTLLSFFDDDAELIEEAATTQAAIDDLRNEVSLRLKEVTDQEPHTFESVI